MIFQLCVFACLVYTTVTVPVELDHTEPDDFSHILDNSDESDLHFWSDENILKALANEKDIVVYNNTEFDDFVFYNNTDFDDLALNNNRSKRSVMGQFWTDDKIRQARPSLPKPSLEYFNQMGVETVTDIRLFASFGTEPARIIQADLTREPWKHYGKLLYKTREGIGACTAAFIDQRVLLTAAHCVKQPTHWYSNFVFFHRYNTNANKGRAVKILQVFAPKSYDNFRGPGYGDLRYDYAFLTTQQTSDAGHLGTKFGHLHETIASAGYPVNAYSGEKLVHTEGKKGLEESGFVNVPSNRMAEGCSGGAWLIKESSGNFAVGVNSHSRPGVPGMFSPKLNTLTIGLFNTAVRRVGGTQVEPDNPDHTDTEPSDEDEPVGQRQRQTQRPQQPPQHQHSHGCNLHACQHRCGANYQWSCVSGREICICG